MLVVEALIKHLAIWIMFLVRRVQSSYHIPLTSVLLLCAIIITAGCDGSASRRLYLRNNAAALEIPVQTKPNPENNPNQDVNAVRFEVVPGTPARGIGRSLQDAGLIHDADLFEAYVSVNGLANRLAAGIFLLSPTMTIPEIAERLQSGEVASLRLTFPEGWRIGQIVDSLKEQSLVESAEIESYESQIYTGILRDLDPADYPFLATRPANTSLEGYLFPDTYQVSIEDSTTAHLLFKQLTTFQSKVMPLYEDAIANAATTMDLYTVLTVASIVEREAVIGAEKPAIAGVYLNRLAQGIKLEADPTVQYGMGYQAESGQWWKTPVFLEEYSSVLSPYNTYLYTGLPPGPIANPGIESIRAVLYPEEHDYIYFVAVPEQNGRHVFAITFEEHQRNVDAYLAGD